MSERGTNLVLEFDGICKWIILDVEHPQELLSLRLALHDVLAEHQRWLAVVQGDLRLIPDRPGRVAADDQHEKIAGSDSIQIKIEQRFGRSGLRLERPGDGHRRESLYRGPGGVTLRAEVLGLRIHDRR